MKLKQKLAAVLAASMIVTAVPVVTYADSSSRVTKTVTVAEGHKFTDAASAPELVISLKDGITTGQAIYLELDGAKWLNEVEDANVKVKGAKEGAEYTFNLKKVNSSEVELKYVSKGEDAPELSNESIYVPLLTELSGGEAVVRIDGNNTNVKSEKVVFGNAVDAEAGVTVGEVRTVFDEGEIAEIIFEEATPGAFAKAENREIEITLEHPDFKFSKAGELVGSKGLSEKLTGASVKIDKRDPQTLIVTLPSNATTSNGKLTLTGVEIESTVRTPEEGEANVYITGNIIENTTLKVADITETDVTVNVSEKDVKEIKGGSTATAKFTIKETKKGGFSYSRAIDFTLTNGHIAKFDESEFDKTHTSDKDKSYAAKVDIFADEVKATLAKANEDLIIKDVEINKYDEVIGFTATIKEGVTDKVAVEFKYSTEVDQAGDVAVKVESRMFEKDFEVVVGKSTVPFTVSTEAAQIFAGKREQVGGKVVIKEAEKRMIESGEIVISLEDEDYISFGDKVPEVKVTEGDLRLGEVEINRNGEVVIEVVRPSRTASTIEISGFVLDTNRLIPNGDYSAFVEIGGFKLEQRNFVEIIEEVKEESNIAANGLKKGVAKFVIGSPNFMVNDESKVMDATPYVSEKGRTMLPVRYVSEAFGLTENEILFTSYNGVGTVTIFAGSRTLQLQNGSNLATLNGVQVAMEEAVVMKEGRTYVPVGEVGRLLGIQVDWDQASQTATFTNK